MSYHEPVLLSESIDALEIQSGRVYVDATFGGGGHAAEILKRLGNGRLITFDQDEDALKNSIDDERVVIINTNFRYMKNFLKYYKLISVDGIIADLGISSHQIDDPERGFSIRFNSDLDLRMDRKGSVSAKNIIADYSWEELKKIFSEYGELIKSGRIAEAIVQERKYKEIVTTDDLKNIIIKFAEKGQENKFFAKVFQALRIEINSEIDALKEFLLQSSDVLNKGGRLVILSYHSLEDRIVKNFMKTGNFSGKYEKDFYGNQKTPFKMITRKPIIPNIVEIENNKRSRSAKLRVAVKEF